MKTLLYSSVVLVVLVAVLRNQFSKQFVNMADLVLDQIYFGLCKLDGVQEFNERSPNYMEGNWIPVHKELKGVGVPGKGNLPLELVGTTYARIGPNLKCWPPTNKHHAFNGEAMIHTIHMDTNSSIKYSNNWIRENLPNKRWDDIGKECGPTFGFADLNDGGLVLFRYLVLKMKSKLKGIVHPPQERIQAGSTAIVHHAEKIFACSELFLPFEIKMSSDSVNPVGFYDYQGKLTNRKNGPVDGTFSAHPVIDEKTGDLYYASTNQAAGSVAGGQPFLDLGVVDNTGVLYKLFHIPIRNPTSAFYHDIMLTENYVIIPETSLKKDVTRLNSFKTLTFYNATEPMRFGIIRRDAQSADETVWIETQFPGHIWHTITAKEEKSKITVYCPKFETYSDRVNIHLTSEEPSYFTKFEINLETRECKEKRISELVVERPSTNPKFLTHRYAYVRSEGLSSREMGSEVVKFDLESETVVGKIRCNPECIFNEALFVPRQNGRSEDDGFLMDIVYYPSSHSSAFAVWDARTMLELPIFESPLPQRVPYGVHGIWFQSLPS